MSTHSSTLQVSFGGGDHIVSPSFHNPRRPAQPEEHRRRPMIIFASGSWRSQSTTGTLFISLRQKGKHGDQSDLSNTLASVGCKKGYVISGDFPFSWQPPTSLKRSPGPWPAIHVLGEGTNGTGGTARLAAMSRMYSMSSYVLPITVFSRRNFKFRIPSLERITSVFPSKFKCAPGNGARTLPMGLGITWRNSVRSQALAQKACRSDKGLGFFSIGHIFNKPPRDFPSA